MSQGTDTPMLQTSHLTLPFSPEKKAQTGFYNFSPLSIPSPSMESHRYPLICRDKVPNWCKNCGDARGGKAEMLQSLNQEPVAFTQESVMAEPHVRE